MATEFRKRLTAYAHKKYCHNNNFYRANVLGEGDLDHVDQRMVDFLLLHAVYLLTLFFSLSSSQLPAMVGHW